MPRTDGRREEGSPIIPTVSPKGPPALLMDGERLRLEDGREEEQAKVMEEPPKASARRLHSELLEGQREGSGYGCPAGGGGVV